MKSWLSPLIPRVSHRARRLRQGVTGGAGPVAVEREVHVLEQPLAQLLLGRESAGRGQRRDHHQQQRERGEFPVHACIL